MRTETHFTILFIKVCFNVPTKLDIRLTVAEGFLHGGETYQKIVNTLDKQLNRTDLEMFEGLDVYQHVNAAKKAINELDRNLPIEIASADVQSHANKQMHLHQCKTSQKRTLFAEKKPELVPRNQGTIQVVTSFRPYNLLDIKGQKLTITEWG